MKKISDIFWQYGQCNNLSARKHRIKGNVQFLLWHVGDQAWVDGVGHKKEIWINFHKSWWKNFMPCKN